MAPHSRQNGGNERKIPADAICLFTESEKQKEKGGKRELKEGAWRSFSKWGSIQSKTLQSRSPITTAHISRERAINSARVNGADPLIRGI